MNENEESWRERAAFLCEAVGGEVQVKGRSEAGLLAPHPFVLHRYRLPFFPRQVIYNLCIRASILNMREKGLPYLQLSHSIAAS